MWNAIKGKQNSRIIEKNSIFALDINADGSRYATAGKDFHIRIYDSETNQLVDDY